MGGVSDGGTRSRSREGDLQPAVGQDIEHLGEQVVRLSVRRQGAGQVFARGGGVPPEEGCGGGVAEGAAQAVGEGAKVGAEVAARPIDCLAERAR